MSVRDAATVILVRESSSAPFEVLMMKRSARSSFMPDVHVYPGGALDLEDCDVEDASVVSGLDVSSAASRLCEPHLTGEQALGLHIAAVREVFEESGILLARRHDQRTCIDLLSDVVVRDTFTNYRAALRRGDLSMSDMMRDEGLVMELGEVGYFARWVTPLVEKKRFDARFFVVLAPRHQQALHDAEEVVDHLWVSPRAMLLKYRTGSHELAPPTFSTLQRLAAFPSLKALMHVASTFAPMPLLPHVRTSPHGVPELLLPHHEEYPEELRLEQLRPIWNERCQDVPPWSLITRDESGWVTK